MYNFNFVTTCYLNFYCKQLTHPKKWKLKYFNTELVCVVFRLKAWGVLLVSFTRHSGNNVSQLSFTWEGIWPVVLWLHMIKKLSFKWEWLFHVCFLLFDIKLEVSSETTAKQKKNNCFLYCFCLFVCFPNRHANLILNLFALMVDANVPDIALEPDKTVKKVSPSTSGIFFSSIIKWKEVGALMARET